MGTVRVLGLALVVLAWAGSVRADDEKPVVSERDFRRAATMFLDNPTGKVAPDLSKVVAIFVFQTPDAAVMLGDDELKWCGKDEDRRWLLLTAYLAGNSLSQLNSGVKRNDRYAGLLHLFCVYRHLKAKDKKFKIAEVDELLKKHKEDKLLPYLIELEKKKPTKLTPEAEKELKKLLKPKKKVDA
jgi:hypothetical protein